MKKVLSLVIASLISTQGLASNVDLYDAQFQSKDSLYRKYKTEIAQLESSLTSFYQNTQANNVLKQVQQKKEVLIARMKKEEGYPYVEVETVLHPETGKHYTTIEVIRKDQPQRMQFIKPVNSQTIALKKMDIVSEMSSFQALQMKLLENKEIQVNDDCPSFSCITDFNHPKLKPFLLKFELAASKNKKDLIKVLNRDLDPRRREAAVLLLGYGKHPKEIINELLPAVKDRDPRVRQTSMMVIAMTMSKAKIQEVNLASIVPLLDSPYQEDRANALMIINQATHIPANKKFILQKAPELVALLELREPKSQEVVYKILKEVSGQNYKASNSQAWQNWAHEQQYI